MAVGKEIRKQIKSIRSTQKITRAMEMVAASKMRRAQERMQAARPYATKIQNVIRHLHHAHPEYRHPCTVEREMRRVGLIVISSDRGLCGGLNTNMFRTLLASMKGWRDQNVEIDVCAIGSKGYAFCRRLGANIVAHASHLGDAPALEQLIGSIKVMRDAYRDGKIDRLYLVYNRFINTMSQQAVVDQMLPLPEAPAEETAQLKHYWDYLYEPDAHAVIDDLMVRYVESVVYRGVIENLACEQSARMVAMKSASDNAGNLIEDLQLRYNKARQAAITQEIAEIVGGAAAV